MEPVTRRTYNKDSFVDKSAELLFYFFLYLNYSFKAQVLPALCFKAHLVNLRRLM